MDRRPPQTRPGLTIPGGGSRKKVGGLASALAPGNLANPTSAIMQVYVRDGAGFVFSLEQITIYNIDQTLSAASGTVVIAEKIFGLWLPIWVGCA